MEPYPASWFLSVFFIEMIEDFTTGSYNVLYVVKYGGLYGEKKSVFD